MQTRTFEKNWFYQFFPQIEFQTLVFHFSRFSILTLTIIKFAHSRIFLLYPEKKISSCSASTQFCKKKLTCYFLTQFEFSNVSFFHFFSHFRDLFPNSDSNQFKERSLMHFSSNQNKLPSYGASTHFLIKFNFSFFPKSRFQT